MKIGVLKDRESETRVALTPDTTKILCGLKAEVLIETGAGQKSFFSDEDYIEQGAKVASYDEVLSSSDLLLKVNDFTSDEAKALKPDQVILGALNPFENSELINTLVGQNQTAFSLELVPRISRAQSMDILSSMATISGYQSVLEAARNLPKFFPMFMSAAGTIKPAKVLILGAGVAGLQAIAFSRKLGAVVEVFDVRSAVKEEVMSLGGKFIEVEGATEDAAAGGYAVEQTEEFKKQQAEMIQQHAIKSDVVICTAQIPGRKAPLLIQKETVKNMKSGSVIIDLAASTGGNCELTQNGKKIVAEGVTIIGKSDYPTEMSFDASTMYSRNIVNFLKLIIDEEGKLNLNFDDEIVEGTCLTHQGEIKNERVKSTIK